MEDKQEVNLKPTLGYALFKTGPLIMLTASQLLLAWTVSPEFVLFGIAAATMACYRLCMILSTSYCISNEHVSHRCGLLFKKVQQMELPCIKEYALSQPLDMQYLKVMNVSLKSLAPTATLIVFKGIPAFDIVELLQKRINVARENKFLSNKSN
jgi:hypothetical protein